MNATTTNSIPERGGSEGMQTVPIAITAKVESYETVAVYIKEGTPEEMAKYTDVVERTKEKLLALGLEYHDIKIGGRNKARASWSGG